MRKLILTLLFIFYTAFCLFAAVQNDNSSFVLNYNSFEKKNNNKNLMNIDKETDRFLKAKEFVFERDWNKAKHRLKYYLSKYPSGQYVDEALYWLAQSLNKLTKNSTELYLVIALKDEAADNLDILLHKFPNSLWCDDAEKLRITIAGDLFMIGDKKQKKKQSEFIDKFCIKKAKDKTDMRLFSYDVLTKLKPEVALAAIERLLEEEKIQQSPVLRKELIALLGTHFPEKGMELLYNFEKNDPDESVRKLASQTIDQIDMIDIPVHLNYFCYAAEFKNGNEFKRLPENKSMIYSIPKTNSTNKRKVEKAAKRFFNNKLTNVKFVSNAFGLTNIYFKLNKLNYKLNLLRNVAEGHGTFDALKNYKFSQFGSMSHNISGFRVQPLDDDFTKDYDQISGKIKFFDKENEKEYIIPYTVNNSHDKLIAMRKGNNVAIMVLQFESEEDLELESEPIYHTKFGDVLGCTVHSSRQTWHLGEMSKIDGVIDFGLAKAEIPTENGTWRLIGNLISDGKTRRIIGRKAVLYDQKRKVIAKGAQIIVPVEKPEKFEVVGDGNK